jgi:hypothetical protein
MGGWLTFPIVKGVRLGISPSRTWLSFPILNGIRGGVSVPVRRKRHARREAAPAGAPKLLRTDRMPGSYIDD